MTMQNNHVSGSPLVLGCMRISGMEKKALEELIMTALDNGVTTFDHADIYGGGRSEELFGEIISEHPALREKMVLQSKCGIRTGYYDFSKEHIMTSVENILTRLHTDYLDTLILHRPDILMEPEEVAEAFTLLKQQGKVKYFGVSNMNAMQIELLQRYVKDKLIVNQLQLSPAHALIIDEGIHVNMPGTDSCGSVLEYCRLNDIGIQSWSSLQYGFFAGSFIGSDLYPELNRKLEEIADKYGITPAAAAIAWILRIPGTMQAVVGTTKPQRLIDLSKAVNVKLERKEWYEIYLSAGHTLP